VPLNGLNGTFPGENPLEVLIDLEPRLAHCRGFSWKTVAKLDDILIFCCLSGVVAVATLPV
jgi:hypothetical protein